MIGYRSHQGNGLLLRKGRIWHGCFHQAETNIVKGSLRDGRDSWWHYLILTLDRSDVLSAPLGSFIILRHYIPFSLETVNVLPYTVCILWRTFASHTRSRYLVNREPCRHGLCLTAFVLMWWDIFLRKMALDVGLFQWQCFPLISQFRHQLPANVWTFKHSPSLQRLLVPLRNAIYYLYLLSYGYFLKMRNIRDNLELLWGNNFLHIIIRFKGTYRF
jgi:hypothetical protein